MNQNYHVASDSMIDRLISGNTLSIRLSETVRDFAPISRADIARQLKISPSTIGRAVDRLIEKKVISEQGQNYGQQAGRPSKILRFNPDIASVLAVDLRLTQVYVAVSNLDGRVLYSSTEPLPREDPQSSIEALLKIIQRQVDALGDAPPLRGIVIGAPSIVDPDAGIVEWAPSLGWKNLPLGRIISSSFNLPVHIENDVNLAALGEYWKGVAQRASSMVFVSVGTGVGAGIVQKGELYYGATHAAGEVGYIITDLKTLHDEVGKMGNLEVRLGEEGTITRANLIAQRYPSSKLAELIKMNGTGVRAHEIFELYAQGDPAAHVIVNETVDLLTVVFTNISLMLDPEIMVLGGPSDWKWAMIVSAIQDRIGSSLLRPVNIVPSLLGRDAVIKGATYIAIRLAGILPK
ncbi:MAG: ROK family transcriptional regulator [Anaerolineales bacterium]